MNSQTMRDCLHLGKGSNLLGDIMYIRSTWHAAKQNGDALERDNRKLYNVEEFGRC